MARRLASLVVASTVIVLAEAAPADPPSSECRSGAGVCHDAVVKLEQCRAKASPDNAAACQAEKSAADEACRSTTGTCHNDGSRRPPRR